MKSKFSSIITEWLFNRKIIQDDEIEIYEYAIFLIVSYCIFFIVSLIIGFLNKIPIESIVFYIIFCLIRNYSGGIHARTESGCSIITTVVLFLSIFTIKILAMYNLIWVAVCTLFLSAVCIVAISPIDNNNKKLKKHEINQNHKKSILLISLTVFLFIIFLVVKEQIISISISVSVTSANLLFLAGKVQQKIINCKKNSA